MSEEQEVQDQGQDAPPAEEKPRGWDQVDFSELPEGIRKSVEDRIHRLYGQVKKSQTTINQMASDQRSLMDKIDLIEHSQSQNAATETIARVRTELKTAMETGDSDLTAAKVAELARLEGQRTVPRETKPQPTEQPVDENPLSAPEVAAINAWSLDKNYMATPGTEDYQWGLSQLNDIWSNNPDLPVEEKLRIMNGRASKKFEQPAKQNGAVLPGDTKPAPKKKATSLSDAQKAVARAMFSGIEPDKAYEKYAKGMGGI